MWSNKEPMQFFVVSIQYANTEVLHISGLVNTEIAAPIIKMHKGTLCFLAPSHYKMLTLEIFSQTGLSLIFLTRKNKKFSFTVEN